MKSPLRRLAWFLNVFLFAPTPAFCSAADFSATVEGHLNLVYQEMANGLPNTVTMEWLNGQLPSYTVPELRMVADLLADRLATLEERPLGVQSETLEPVIGADFRSPAMRRTTVVERDMDRQISAVVTTMSLLALKVRKKGRRLEPEEQHWLRTALRHYGYLVFQAATPLPAVAALVLHMTGAIDAPTAMAAGTLGTGALAAAGGMAGVMGVQHRIVDKLCTRAINARRRMLARFAARAAERVSGVSAEALEQALLKDDGASATSEIQKHLCAAVLTPPGPQVRVADFSEEEAQTDEAASRRLAQQR